MNEFQKIAIGLLGLTHPEMFIPRRKSDAAAAAGTEPGSAEPPRSSTPRRLHEGPGARVLRALQLVVSALAIGSRTVPLADNSELRRDLNARVALIYGAERD